MPVSDHQHPDSFGKSRADSTRTRHGGNRASPGRITLFNNAISSLPADVPTLRPEHLDNPASTRTRRGRGRVQPAIGRPGARIEVPPCPYSNSRGEPHPGGIQATDCEQHKLRNAFLEALRRDRIAAGEHVVGKTANRARPGNRRPELLTPVPKCRLQHQRADRLNCEHCKRRHAFLGAKRRQEERDGIADHTQVPCDEAQQLLNVLLTAGGHTLRSICNESGLGRNTLTEINAGSIEHVQRITFEALQGVKPRPAAIAGAPTGHVAGIGTARKLRALNAQGFTFKYLSGLLGHSAENTAQLASRAARSRRFVSHETADAVQRLVDKLGEFDIADMAEPMDGMNLRCARQAERKGWATFADWHGIDIDDPNAEPHRSDPMDASNGMVLVDPRKVEFALDFEPIRVTDGERQETVVTQRFTAPITMLELYEIVRVGSERDHTGVVRVSSNLLSQRLGVAERSIQRYRAELTRANWLLDAVPALPGAVLAANLILDGGGPAAVRLDIVSRLLARYPISALGFYRDLVILGATQPRPYGRGWSDDALAAWLGCTEADAATMRARAVLAGRQYQDIRPGVAARPRKLGVDMPNAA